jgi:hypothetical protein
MAESRLDAVTAIPGTNQLWAVGSQMKTISQSPYTELLGAAPYEQPLDVNFAQSLIERWDGSAWQVVPAPPAPRGAITSVLTGVVALSATDAWAVGTYLDTTRQDSHPLIAHWDGVTWKLVAAPYVWGRLSGLAAVGAHDVRAVGERFVEAGASNDIGIVERWDGTTWSVSDLPTPQGITDIFPEAITPDGAGGYWVVGYYYASTYHPLVERC